MFNIFIAQILKDPYSTVLKPNLPYIEADFALIKSLVIKDIVSFLIPVFP